MCYVRIGLTEVLLPNCLVAYCKCAVNIVLAIDSIILIVHPSVDDKWWTHFALFPSSDRSVS